MSGARRPVALVLGALLLAAVAQVPALAHTWTDWHTHRWTTTVIGGVQTDRNVDWRFVDNFPSGNGERNRVREAADRWTNVGTTLRFNYESGASDYASLDWGQCSSGYQNDKVGWTNIGASGFSNSEPLGQAQSCHFSSNENAAWSFKVRFNNDAPWYFGSDGSVPDTRYDLLSVAVHEFGHATGRYKGGDGDGHFTEGSDYCPNYGSSNFSYRHSMCPSTVRGTSAGRSLETHDRDVLQNAY